MNTAALAVIYLDKERWAMGPRERVWGYTGAGGMLQGFAAGYFLWDLMISAENMDVHGLGALAHAVSALAVSLLGFVSCSCDYLLINDLSREKTSEADRIVASDRSATTTASISSFTSSRPPSSTSIGSWINSA